MGYIDTFQTGQRKREMENRVEGLGVLKVDRRTVRQTVIGQLGNRQTYRQIDRRRGRKRDGERVRASERASERERERERERDIQ